MGNLIPDKSTKTQRGMRKTQKRSGHNLKISALTLMVRGSTDILGANWMHKKQVPKPITYMLTDAGRRRLFRMRDKRK